MASNGKTSGTLSDVLIQQSIAQDDPNRYITKAELDLRDKQIKGLEFIVNMQAQQIVSFDVALSLAIEQLGKSFTYKENTNKSGKPDGSQTLMISPWTKEDLDSFKKECQRRVQQIADDMAKRIAVSQKKVQLA